VRRCKTCHILGEEADVDRHEPSCTATSCHECEGRGWHVVPGCHRGQIAKCSPCGGYGVVGGLMAMAEAQRIAREDAEAAHTR
jgi:hypothetical protein